jgi:putative Mg2+ transporter-C (MgtC) family protein
MWTEGKMIFAVQDVVKLLLALLIGGLIGAEREFRDKAAGFRTIIFICVGATLFTIISIKLGSPNEPSRIAASIVSGVGFLGAGAILRAQGRVIGLTTASTIWLAAALGMAIGGGDFSLAGVTALLALVVLLAFPGIEAWIDRVWEVRTYTVGCEVGSDVDETLEGMFAASGLRILRIGRSKHDNQVIYTWYVSGTPDRHQLLVDKLIRHPGVIHLET